MTLHHYLILAAVLFCVGLMGAFTRRNAIVVLFSVEIMLNAANLNFIAFWRYSDNPRCCTGRCSRCSRSPWLLLKWPLAWRW